MRAAIPLLTMMASVSILVGADLVRTKLPPAAQREVQFAQDIKPLLERSCLKCHGPEKPKSGFQVDTRESILKGGESKEVAILPGDSAKSPLLHYTAGLIEDMEMPPLDKRDSYPTLTRDELGLLRAWIDQGARWPEGVTLSNRSVIVNDAGPGSTAANKLTPSFFAKIREGGIGEIPAISEQDQLLSLRDEHGNSPLMLGAFYLDAAQLELLLKKGFDLNAANDAGVTALMWAAADLAKTRLLLQHGANVNAISKAGNTALSIVCQQPGSHEIVKELLEWRKSSPRQSRRN